MVVVKCPKCGKIKSVKVYFLAGLYCENCEEYLDSMDIEFQEKEIYDLKDCE